MKDRHCEEAEGRRGNPGAALDRRAAPRLAVTDRPDGAPAALLLDLLAWIAVRRRSYGETMEAWRTSCPRLPVWEDAVDAGLIEIVRGRGAGLSRSDVRLTRAGRDRLRGRSA